MKVSVLFLVLCLSVAGNSVFAQIQNVDGLGGTVVREQKYKNVEGTPFLFPTYKAAKVFDRSGGSKSVFAKYDSYKEEVEVHNDGNPIILDAKVYGAVLFDFIDEIDNSRVRLLFKNGYNIEGFRSTDYFQVIKDEGRYKFLKKVKTNRIDSKETSYGGTNDVSSRFVQKRTYFIIDGENVTTFKKVSKSTILKMFGDTESDAVYLKKNKNKLKTEFDVISFLAYKESN